jgi:hypothetical protein
VKGRIVTLLSILAMLGGLAFLGFLGWMWWESRLPGSYDVMDYGVVDLGGGPDSAAAAFSVARTAYANPPTGSRSIQARARAG